MAEPKLLLWDVGGVVLSNAWDHESRAGAARQFGLDPAEFERRHALVVGDFEGGRMDLPTYLARTVFYEPRGFSPDAFRTFMRPFRWRRCSGIRRPSGR